MEEELDNSWVDDYKKKEELYNEFYNEKINNVKVFFMYVNNENVMINVKQEILTLIDSMIKREQLIILIKNKQYLNNVKYKLLSIVRYNIDLQPEEIEDFISVNNNISDNNNNYVSRFLINEENLNDIIFTDTISILQDLNSLYIIYREPSIKKTHISKTKRNNKFNFNRVWTKRNRTTVN